MNSEEIKIAAQKIIAAGMAVEGSMARAVGAAFDRMLGSKFSAEEFVKHGGHFEWNVVPFDAELTLAATTAFADGTFTLTNGTDTFRLILGVGILLHDDGAGITNGPVEQLNTAGRLEIKRNVGKQRTWAFGALNLGPAAPQHPDQLTTLVSSADQEKVIPYAKLLPHGVQAALLFPVDALVKASDTFSMKFTGLNGVTLDDSHSGLKAEAMAYCIDVVMGR